MQIPARYSAAAMQAGAEQPEARAVTVLHPVIVADAVAFRDWIVRAGFLGRDAPPFCGDALGALDGGDVVQHPSFGVGVATAIKDAKKVEVLFHDGARVLIQGL